MIRLRGVLIFVLICLTACNAFAESAAEVQSDCRLIKDGKVRGDSVVFTQTFDSGVCWGRFVMLQQMTHMFIGEEPVIRVCPPEGVGRVQLIKVFYNYMDKHPERGHEDFLEVVNDALLEVWPCSKEDLKKFKGVGTKGKD